jgi:hypothetical protein
MNATIAREYKRLRSKGWNASSALDTAKVRDAWETAGGFSGDSPGVYLPDPDDHPVRLRFEPDDDQSTPLDADFENDKQRAEVARLIEVHGVYGIIGEYWNGEEWVHADSCWGFIGNDLRDNGYDTDIMRATLEAWNALETCHACGRPKV